MLFRLVVGCLVLLLIPHTIVAQASALSDEVVALHRVVFETPPDTPFPPAAAARELGLRYVEGRGVNADPTLGCGVLQLAYASQMFASSSDQSALAPYEGLLEKHCRSFNKDDNEEVGQMMGCPVFGPKRLAFNLEPGSWVEVGKASIWIDRPEGRTQHPIAGNLTCNHQRVLVRHIQVEPPQDIKLSARHFVELLSWTSSHGPRKQQRALMWTVMEIVGSKIEHATFDALVTEAGSVWPTPPIPDHWQNGATYTMLATGAVRWRLAGEPRRSGVIDPNHSLPPTRKE